MKRALSLLLLLAACGRTEAPAPPLTTAPPIAPAIPPPAAEPETDTTGDPSDSLPLVPVAEELDTPEARTRHPEVGKGLERLRIIVAKPRLTGHELLVRAYVVNETAAPITFPTRAGPFDIDFGPATLVRERPVNAPPPPPPALVVYTVPARSRQRFSSSIGLDRYAYTAGGRVDLTWSFSVSEKAARSGIFTGIALPKDGPRGEVRPLPPG